MAIAVLRGAIKRVNMRDEQDRYRAILERIAEKSRYFVLQYLVRLTRRPELLNKRAHVEAKYAVFAARGCESWPYPKGCGVMTNAPSATRKTFFSIPSPQDISAKWFPELSRSPHLAGTPRRTVRLPAQPKMGRPKPPDHHLLAHALRMLGKSGCAR
ncbi:MAG: hypothetical protein IPI44_05220 [Sulfuritalea sp.]|nr:hypothetical protein [Sulfuritalea sp.]